jgi:steroid 5-alpha reductase family enzyme
MCAAAIAVLTLMHVAFLTAVFTKRNDVADIAWGPGFLVAALVALARRCELSDSYAPDLRTILAIALVAVWGLRLGWHIGVRNIRKPKEDPRYAKMRADWGDQWIIKSYFIIFLLQGLLLLIIVSPVIAIIGLSDGTTDVMTWLGVAVWAIGFLFESVGDHQLKVFLSKPESKGRLMTEGLWGWSRHPNYFGEVAQWWGIFLIAVTLPGAWPSLISPVVITFLILKVSGVPMLEDGMRDRPGFAEYCRRTSKFFPLPPRKA